MVGSNSVDIWSLCSGEKNCQHQIYFHHNN